MKNFDGIWMPKYKWGIMVWTPPPAAAHFTFEQLRETRNKRTKSIHIVILPRLFTSHWKRQLWRVSDVHFELPFDDSIWSKSIHHEPLVLTIILPFYRFLLGN